MKSAEFILSILMIVGLVTSASESVAGLSLFVLSMILLALYYFFFSVSFYTDRTEKESFHFVINRFHRKEQNAEYLHGVSWVLLHCTTGIVLKWTLVEGAGFILFIGSIGALLLSIYYALMESGERKHSLVPVYIRFFLWGTLAFTFLTTDDELFSHLRYPDNSEKAAEVYEKLSGREAPYQSDHVKKPGESATRDELRSFVHSRSPLLYKDFEYLIEREGDVYDTYTQGIRRFYTLEIMAMEVYERWDNNSREDNIKLIRNRGLYYYTEALLQVRELDKLDLQSFQHEWNQLLIDYCVARIAVYSLKLQKLEERTMKYNSEIRNAERRIQLIVEQLNTES